MITGKHWWMRLLNEDIMLFREGFWRMYYGKGSLGTGLGGDSMFYTRMCLLKVLKDPF